MAKVKLLEKTVAERIAAGEVVERPASIVKELVENSLDAGATRITVEMRAGGIKMLRVTDNGCGMSTDDMSLAIQRFATSKITDWNDLASLTTLGFRGEALPSIAAVSRLSMKSCLPGADSGSELYVEGAGIPLIKPCACPPGTRIEVNDLFYNTPARLKFLRSPVAEATNIIDLLGRMAVARPDVHFRLLSNDKEVFSFPVGVTTAQRLARLWKIPDDTLIPISREVEEMAVDGFVALPSFTRNNRNYQLILLNGRIIKSANLSQAIQEGFTPLLPRGRFPVGVIRVTLPPDIFDVNVHPNKLEVRFIDNRPVFGLVYGAVAQALEYFNADTVQARHLDYSRELPQRDVPLNRGESYASSIESFSNNKNLLRDSHSDDRKIAKYDPNRDSHGLMSIIERVEAVNENQLAISASEKALASEGYSQKRLPEGDINFTLSPVPAPISKNTAKELAGYELLESPGRISLTKKKESSPNKAILPVTVNPAEFNGVDTLSCARVTVEPPATPNPVFNGSETLGVAKIEPAPIEAEFSESKVFNGAETIGVANIVTISDVVEEKSSSFNGNETIGVSMIAPVRDSPKGILLPSSSKKLTSADDFQENLVQSKSEKLYTDDEVISIDSQDKEKDAEPSKHDSENSCEISDVSDIEVKPSSLHQEVLLDEGEIVSRPVSRFQLFGQVHNTFIVGLVDGELWVIDQHTAHERLNYERLGHLDPLHSRSQSLLIPEVLEFSPIASEYLASSPEELAEFGFEVEPFGKNTFQLRAVPSALSERRIVKTFRELIEELVGGKVSMRGNIGESMREKLRAMTSCKAAVKAGDALSSADMQKLVEDMLEVEHSRYCPHGRPTRVQLDKKVLERLFHR